MSKSFSLGSSNGPKRTNPDQNVFIEFERLYYVMNSVNCHVNLIGEKALRQPSDELNVLFGVPTMKDLRNW
ncbi:hypothetical protein [Domibacillus robiginosus]|uniref:hypothetical protein n=1 Tax=Domibacillus robiginosus TaxID=1071054 RepID=UPI000A743C78|nr:hypothetical protein [Domibacillus robiginosus]